MEEVTETIADLSKRELCKLVVKRTKESMKYLIALEIKDKKIKELEGIIEKMDIDIGDKGDQIASLMTDKLKQNQFEITKDKTNEK